MRRPVKQAAGDRQAARVEIREALRLGYLLSEKCELKEAAGAFGRALELSKSARDYRAMMEALSGLLRLAGEALDLEAIDRWDRELDRVMAAHPHSAPPMVWYCKGVISYHRDNLKVAQRFYHRYLRAVREDLKAKDSGSTELSGQVLTIEEQVARGWTVLAMTLFRRNRFRRAKWLAEEVLRRCEGRTIKGVNGVVHMILGRLAERERDFDCALAWYQKAHASFLSEHNWYSHLHVLYGYARVARMQQNYAQAYGYLDLLEKACSGPEFGVMRREIATERARLEQDAVDLLIDSRRGLVRTREGGQVSLRKQYLLLHILAALSQAHHRPGGDSERGLSKAEIIERVWQENYRPEAHDNKLYYNINRLRKLIEPDMKAPQYLQNWKEGYRLAPGLRVHFVGAIEPGGLRRTGS